MRGIHEIPPQKETTNRAKTGLPLVIRARERVVLTIMRGREWERVSGGRVVHNYISEGI